MKHVAIITQDTLSALGLQGLLVAYFTPIEVDMMTSFNVEEAEGYDAYFVSDKYYVSHIDFFIPHRAHTMIISSGTEGEKVLNVHASQEEMLGQLEDFFAYHTDIPSQTLSDREIQVLKMVAKGAINKEIAQSLSISFNTVLTHRKNITAKLGIKTVSGLTFYAVMNGYISPSDIDL